MGAPEATGEATGLSQLAGALGLGCLCTTEDEVDAKLAANQATVDKIAAVLLWRNLIGTLFTLALVNALFYIVRKFELGFVPTLVFAWIVQILLSLVDEAVPAFFARVYPAVSESEKAKGGSNAFPTIEVIGGWLKPAVRYWTKAKEILFGEPALNVPFIAATFGAVLVLVVLACIGTLPVLWFLADAALILPGLLLLPAVNVHVVKLLNMVMPQRAKAD